MKKIEFITLCTAILLCITACSGNNKVKEFVLTNTPIDGQEVVDIYKNSSECEDIYLDNKKNVVVLLTEKQRIELLHSQLIENPESFSFPLGDIGPSFSLKDNCKQLFIKGTTEEIIAFEETAKNYAFEAELQQILNGENDWHLKVVLTDSETNTILHTFSLPEEELDWSVLQDKYPEK